MSSLTQKPHDALFKYLFGQPEHARGVLQTLLPPALLSTLDLGTLHVEPDTFVDETLAERQSDLLYTVQMGGQTGMIYVLFEHQSSDDPQMAFRMLRYVVRIVERWCRDNRTHDVPPVVPLVLYHGSRPWASSVQVASMFRLPHPCLKPLVPHMAFRLYDLSRVSEEHLMRGSWTAFARISLLAFKTARGPTNFADRLVRWTDVFQEMIVATHGLKALEAVLRYSSQVNKMMDLKIVETEVLPLLAAPAKEVIMDIYEELEARGLKKGLALGRVEGLKQGIEQGIEQGRPAVQRALLVSLEAKFGAVSETTHAAVMAADMPTLIKWVDAVHDGRSLDGEIN